MRGRAKFLQRSGHCKQVRQAGISRTIDVDQTLDLVIAPRCSFQLSPCVPLDFFCLQDCISIRSAVLHARMCLGLSWPSPSSSMSLLQPSHPLSAKLLVCVRCPFALSTWRSSTELSSLEDACCLPALINDSISVICVFQRDERE